MTRVKKKILLIGNIPPPFGGVPAHILNLAPYLKKNGWEVSVLSSGYPRGIYYNDGVKIFKPSTKQNIIAMLSPAISIRDIFSYSYLLKFSLKRFVGMVLFSNRIAKIIKTEKIDVVSAYHLYAGLAALPAAKVENIPLVTTIFGEIFSEKSLYLQIADKVDEVLNYSAEILSCSMHCGRSIEQIGLRHKVDTHYYGVDTAYFSHDNEASFSRARFKWDAEDKVIIFVGRMNKSLGLDTLLNAIPSLIDADQRIRFLICGADGPLSLDAFETERGYPENVKVFVNINTEDLKDCYLISDLAVAPSINERACLGLAIIEAMSSELPVIACNVGGTSEVVIDSETGILIQPKDPLALAKAILQLLNEENLKKQMGAEGRKVARERFDVQISNIFALNKFEQLVGR